MPADVALAQIEWLGDRREVEVVIIEGTDAPIGTELLADTSMTIDYPGRTVSMVKEE